VKTAQNCNQLDLLQWLSGSVLAVAVHRSAVLMIISITWYCDIDRKFVDLAILWCPEVWGYRARIVLLMLCMYFFPDITLLMNCICICWPSFILCYISATTQLLNCLLSISSCSPICQSHPVCWFILVTHCTLFVIIDTTFLLLIGCFKYFCLTFINNLTSLLNTYYVNC